MVTRTTYEGLFAEHRSHLWAISYRVTGSATDADDLVQDTFARALERPPEDQDRPWRPWLARVATNLAIDHLRRRKARAYVGPWLPELISSEVAVAEREPTADEGDPECRYSMLQSVRLAFLVAIEALDPRSRAVLVLRDVMGYTGPECADILGLTAVNVRVTLHRARKQLGGYDEAHDAAASGDAERSMKALQAMFVALSTNDVAGATACVRNDVRVVTDGGGQYSAATKEVVGIDRAMRLLLGLAQGAAPRIESVETRSFNAEAMLVVRVTPHRARDAPLLVLQADLDAQGRICVLRTISAPQKLAALGL